MAKKEKRIHCIYYSNFSNSVCNFDFIVRYRWNETVSLLFLGKDSGRKATASKTVVEVELEKKKSL